MLRTCVALLSLWLVLWPAALHAEPPASGEPLPDDAVARLGTSRLRHAGVTAVVLSPDGSLAASANGTDVRVWDTKTGLEVERFRGKGIFGDVVAFSADGKTLLAASRSGPTIQQWDVASATQLRKVQVKERYDFATGFSADGSVCIFGSYSGGKAAIIDTATGQERLKLDQPDGIFLRDISADGKWVVTSTRTGAVHLRDAKSGEKLREWNEGKGGIVLKLSPDSKVLAAAPVGAPLRLWDVSNGKEVQKFAEECSLIAFSPNGRTLALVRQGTVNLVDGKSGKTEQQIKGPPERRITDMAFSGDGRLLALAVDSTTIQLYDASTGKRLLTGVGHDSGIGSLAFSPDGKSLASSGGKLIVWDLAKSKPHYVVNDLPGTGWSLAWSPDGSVLASGDGTYSARTGYEAAIRLLEARTGTLQKDFKAHLGNVHSLAYSPDGKQLASVGADARVRVWDPATGKRLHQIRVDENFSHMRDAVCYARDGKTLLYTSIFGQAETYATEDWKQLAHFEAPAATRQRSLFSAILPEGKTLVTREGPSPADPRNQKVELCFRDLENGRVTRSVSLAKANPYDFSSIGRALSPDGSVYAEAVQWKTDYGFRAWDTATGKLIAERFGHSSPVGTMAFSPDGRLLATGSSDTTIMVWDAAGLRLNNLWTDLTAGADDAARAVEQLSKAENVSWLGRRLRAVAERYARAVPLIAQLEDDDFEKREKASSDLAAQGTAARFALELALADKPSAEKKRRIEELLKKLPPPVEGGDSQDGRRAVRAVAVLERIHTDEARALLRELAKGAEQLPTTHEAREALKRLDTPKSSGKQTRRQGDQETRRQQFVTAKPPELKEVASWKAAGTTLLAFSPDGHTLVGGSPGKPQGEAKLWDARTGREIASLGDVARGVIAVAYSADGKLLATYDTNGKVVIRDAATGKESKSLTVAPQPEATQLAFAVDGKTVVVAGYKTVHVLPLEEGGQASSFQRRIPGYGSAVSRDGQTLASPNYQDLDLWDVKTGKIRRTLEDHPGVVWAAAFSADGKTVAAAVQRNDGKRDFWQVQLWDAVNGKELMSVPGDTGHLRSILLDDPAKTLVVLHIPVWQKQEVEMCVYDLATGKERCARRRLVRSAVLGPDGKQIATVEGDNLHVWELPPTK